MLKIEVNLRVNTKASWDWGLRKLTQKNEGNPEKGFWNMAIFGLKGWDGYGLNIQTQVLERV